MLLIRADGATKCISNLSSVIRVQAEREGDYEIAISTKISKPKTCYLISRKSYVPRHIAPSR
jgi:hypothetical protein